MYLSFLTDNLFHLLGFLLTSQVFHSIGALTISLFNFYNKQNVYIALHSQVSVDSFLCSSIFIFYQFIISVIIFFFYISLVKRKKTWSLRKSYQLCAVLTNYMFEYFKNTKTLTNHTISTLLNLCLKEVYRNFIQHIYLRIYISTQLLDLIYL